MLGSMIGLLSSFLGSGLWNFVFIPILCLAFICTVPFIIRLIWRD